MQPAAQPKRKSGRLRRKIQPGQGQGILLNNYFPALEGGNRASSSQDEEKHLTKAQRQQRMHMAHYAR